VKTEEALENLDNIFYNMHQRCMFGGRKQSIICFWTKNM